MSKPRLPPKKDVALALLESTTVFLHLDPRAQDVRVPPWFKRQPQLVLQVGLNMPVPIPDLVVNEKGISCTLSFSRTPHFCDIPWKAIYALVGEDGRGMVWPDDVPPEIAAQAQAQADAKEKRGHLRAVAPGEGATEPPAAAEQKPARKSKAPARPRKNLSEAETKASTSQPQPTEIPSAPTADTPEAAATPDSSAESKKPKRELPPYLRVVK